MKLDIYQKSGNKSTKKVTLESTVFCVNPNEHSIYLAVNSEMAAMRQGTHSSKTKGEVRGTGAKPWRQKGTGRSRIGYIRNPSRVHGSKAFGPKPHGYDKKVNKKVSGTKNDRNDEADTMVAIFWAGRAPIFLKNDFNWKNNVFFGSTFFIQLF